MGYIYKITNLINNKHYIGKTKYNILGRFKTHLRISKRDKPKTYLHKSIKKHGIDNFSIDLIENVNECFSNLDDMEKLYIKLYNSHIPNGYNMTVGGDGGDTSKSPNYKNSILNRNTSGVFNPLYGKRGKNNPKFGKKYGSKPNISIGQKKNWINNDERKAKASVAIIGSKNPMFNKIPSNAIKVTYENKTYESIAAASRELNMSCYNILKNGGVKHA